VVPHANELQAEFGDRGFQIIGVTGANEPKDRTSQWIEDKGARYAYCYSADAGPALGVRGIPHGVLVDPFGRIVWRGNPSYLSADEIEKAIEGALPTPLWDWPESTAGVQEQIRAANWAGAHAAAVELSDKDLGKSIADFIGKSASLKVEGVKASYEAGDILGATESIASFGDSLKGLEAGRTLAELAKEIAADKEAQKILELQRKIASLGDIIPGTREAFEELLKDKEGTMARVEEAIGELESIAKEYSGKFVARQAEAMLEDLEPFLTYLESL
jgi:hypothetical protein